MPEPSPGYAELAVRMRACTACPELVAARQSVVVGDLPTGARLLLLGEAPGAEEDRSGRPFVGRAGRLLDDTLAAAGLARADVAVVNTLKCRPPDNRRPTGSETAACRPWTEALLDLADPAVVVTLGATATAWALGPRRGLLRDLRGRVHEVAGRRVLPTYHPSAALRSGPLGQPAVLLRADLELARRLAG